MLGQMDGDHRYYEGLAVAHVLGGLDESDGRVFRAHLLECTDCRARVGELRAIAHELADVERDERRQRAAKAIETKRREADDDQALAADAVVSARSSRTVVVVGLVLVVALSVWNFTLREENTRLRSAFQVRTQAAEALQFGTPWIVVPAPDSAFRADRTAKEHEGRLVLYVEGLDDAEVYGLYLLGADQSVKGRPLPVQSVDGEVFSVVKLPHGAVEARLTNPEGAPPKTPAGEILFRACDPSAGC